MKMKITATGDAILTQGYKKGGYEGQEILQNYIAKGDAKFGNLEICITDWNAWASTYCGGIWMSTTPDKLSQITDYGFNFMGYANNHTMDYGPEGLRQTLEATKNHDISVTGAGENLAKASEPVYRDFEGGRVAFIALTSSLDDSARAGHATQYIPGRPGVNPLRFSSHITVTQEHFDILKEITA